jgi:hypothetical protein
MKRAGHWLPLFAGTLILLAGIGGCAENSMEPDEGVPPGSVTNETQAMEYYASADEFVSNEDLAFADLALEPIDPDAIDGVSGTIIPVTWGRFVENVATTMTTTIETGDSLATVKVDKDITGTLRILAKYSEDDTTTFLIEKPFYDHSVRNVVFKRVGKETRRFWLNWVPVSTSLADGKTVAPPADMDVNITELQFVKPSGDTITITEPTEFYMRYHWRNTRCNRARVDVPQLSMGEAFSVRATVVSASADTDIVTLRYGASPVAHTRMGMKLVSEADNGDGTFTRVYEVSAEVRHHPGFFHAGVVVKSRKTLFDDDPASYSVNWWGMPYRVL